MKGNSTELEGNQGITIHQFESTISRQKKTGASLDKKKPEQCPWQTKIFKYEKEVIIDVFSTEGSKTVDICYMPHSRV